MRLEAALVACILSTTAGCGSADDAGPEAAVEPATAGQRESVFDPLTSTIDRAEGVEDTLRDAADERRRQLEEAEL